MNKQVFGKKLKNLRKRENLSAEAVANTIGVSVSSYNKYEQGLRIPRDEIKERIAHLFECSIESIFFES